MAVAVWVLGCLPAPARSPVPNYFLRAWQTEDGLPQNSVTAVVQTRDGYLWLGTYNGLVRFDGVRFAVFDTANTPALKSSRVTSLFADPGGTLWIGHETGDLTRLDRGDFAPVTIPGGWDGGKIVSLGADEAGDVWLLNEAGSLARVRDGLRLPPDARAAGTPGPVALCRDTEGRLCVLRGGAVAVLEAGRLVPLPLGAPSTDGYVQAICASRSGGLWIVRDGRVRQWKRQRWEEDRGTCPWGQSSVTALFETQAGALMAGTLDQGVYLLRPDGAGLHFSRTNGLSHDWVRCLCEDHEGNLWVGVGSGGLNALRATPVATVDAPDAWQGRAVLSVTAARDGALWVGTEGAGLYRLRDRVWTRFSEADGLANPFIWSIAEDARGQLWVGTWGGGLFVRRGERFERAPGLEGISVPMPALLPGRDGELWVGTGAGLLHYEAGHAAWFGRPEGLVLPDVRTVVEDAAGAVWFGMSGGGLGRLTDGKLRQFRKSDGLPNDFVLCLHSDRDGALWIGTFGGGLCRLKSGRFATISTANGLPNNVICHIEDDGRGSFWMSSYGGLIGVRATELNRCADGQTASLHCVSYTTADGLPTLECSGGLQPAGCQTVDGRLWFPTTKGLVALDPTDVQTNALPPPVVIEECLVDGKAQGPKPPLPGRGGGTGDNPSLRVPPSPFVEVAPGQHRFEFRYTGLSFTAPEKVRFKYRLEGLESEWEDAGRRRSADYRYLPPGDYAFRVIACNNDGVWNPQGATLALTIRPQFWQTWWFRLSAGGAAAAGVGGLVLLGTRRRLRRKLERLERQRAVERERARIAQDIHDDLGASLTRITLLSQSARGELDHPEQAATDLDRIYRTARELTRAMDEIVWAVNPRHDTLDSLATYLGRFAQEFLSAAGLRCRLDLPLRLPARPLTADVRHNLFLAFKEALHNVLKHAGATEVRVVLALQPSAFSLAVEDNGRGFAPGPAGAAARPEADRMAPGNGLANLRRRLEEIGGRCEIRSTPGEGTKVRFVVALPPRRRE